MPVDGSGYAVSVREVGFKTSFGYFRNKFFISQLFQQLSYVLLLRIVVNIQHFGYLTVIIGFAWVLIENIADGVYQFFTRNPRTCISICFFRHIFLICWWKTFHTVFPFFIH